VNAVIEITTGLTLTLAALGALYRLARSPRDLPLWVLAPGLAFLAFAATGGIALPAIQHAVVHALGKAMDSELRNVGWLVMAYCFAAFFVAADPNQDLDRRRRTLLVELAILAMCLITMTVAHRSATPQIWSQQVRLATFSPWQRVTYDAVSDLYAVGAGAVGLTRAVRYIREVDHRWSKIGLGVFTTGAAAMIVGVDGSATTIDTLRGVLEHQPPRFPVLDAIYHVGLHGGQILLACGLVVTTVSDVVFRVGSVYDARIRARLLPGLDPLWERLTHEFPFIVLDEMHDDDPDERGPADTDPTERRIEEISDGLTRLGPYAHGLRSRHGVRWCRQAARVVHDALRLIENERQVRWAGGYSEPLEPPYLPIEPNFRSWRARVRWMRGVSRELARIDSGRREGSGDNVAVG
jgi:hypothetical protein